eukprot:3629-Rhodomonas_salina.1
MPDHHSAAHEQKLSEKKRALRQAPHLSASHALKVNYQGRDAKHPDSRALRNSELGGNTQEGTRTGVLAHRVDVPADLDAGGLLGLEVVGL